jgi:hypothetical protein
MAAVSRSTLVSPVPRGESYELRLGNVSAAGTCAGWVLCILFLCFSKEGRTAPRPLRHSAFPKC